MYTIDYYISKVEKEIENTISYSDKHGRELQDKLFYLLCQVHEKTHYKEEKIPVPSIDGFGNA